MGQSCLNRDSQECRHEASRHDDSLATTDQQNYLRLLLLPEQTAFLSPSIRACYRERFCLFCCTLGLPHSTRPNTALAVTSQTLSPLTLPLVCTLDNLLVSTVKRQDFGGTNQLIVLWHIAMIVWMHWPDSDARCMFKQHKCRHSDKAR